MLASQAALADVLVAKNGKRWEGQVVDKGDRYILTRPGGGKITFPKRMVRKIIWRKDLVAEFERMLEGADLTDDAQLDKLLAFTDENRLAEQRQKLLAEAYARRSKAAKDDPATWRRMASWWHKRNAVKQAQACERRANQCEFQAKLAAARSDAARLEELARWCLEREMLAEAEQCLSPHYESRKQQAKTPEQIWRLAQWCHKWKMDQRRAECRTAAINAAVSSGDLSTLNRFLEALEIEGALSPIARTCARAVHALRLKQAGQDARALARLAAWCEVHGLQAEGTRAEAAALQLAPEDADVRRELSYVKDIVGNWTKVADFDAGAFNQGKYKNRRVRWKGVVNSVKPGLVNVALPSYDTRVGITANVRLKGEPKLAVRKGMTVVVEGKVEPRALVTQVRAETRIGVFASTGYTVTLNDGIIVAILPPSQPGKKPKSERALPKKILSIDERKRMAEGFLSAMGELTRVLGTVQDRGSAEAAKPRIATLVKRMESMGAKLAGAAGPTEREGDLLQRLYAEKVKSALQGLMAQIARIQNSPALRAVLGDRLNELQR